MLYGTSKAITEYIDLGDDYSKVKKVYSVSIVYFGIGQGEDYAYHGKTEFRGMNKPGDVLRLSKKQQEQFKHEFAGDLYPEYFLLKVDDFDSIAKNSLDEWISFLQTGEIPESFTAPGLPEARERLKEAGMSEDELRRYRGYMDNLRDARSALSTSYMDGEEKGRVERNKEVAKNMKAESISVDAISRVTGLSAEEIAGL